jgi:hypothetical protein
MHLYVSAYVWWRLRLEGNNLKQPSKKIGPETQIKRACLQYLKYRYGSRLWYVNIVGGLGIRPGTPDTLAVLDGKFIGIEFKAGDRGKLSDYQREALRQIEEAGGIGLVIRSLDQCMEFFKHYKPGVQGELF